MRREEWLIDVPLERENEIEEILAFDGIIDFYFESVPNSKWLTLHLYGEEHAYKIMREFSLSGVKRFFDDEDWIEVWRKSLKLVKIEEDVYVNPDPERIPSPPDGITVVVTPGMAFGTGEHETTKLAARLLLKAVKKAKPVSVCDVGCGTGVLSALACKVGVKRVLAVDVDEKALSQAIETAKINGVFYEVRKSNLLENVEEKFDLYVANIVYDVIKNLVGILPSNSLFVASGVDKTRKEKFKSLCEKFELLEERCENEWCAFLMRT